MTDRQDHGQQPQQYWQGQPWPPPQHDPRDPWDASAAQPPGSGQQPYGSAWPQPGQQAYGQWYPSPQQGFGPPVGPPRRKPWAARHKVLTGFLACFGLLLVIGIAEGGSSSSSSTKVNATSSPVSATSGPSAGTGVAVSPAAKKTAPAAHTAAAASSVPARTTPASSAAASSAPARTTPATTAAAPSTPAHTVPSVPTSPASTAPAGCHPLTSGGKCYEPGEFCRTTDQGASGVAGDGEAIVCELNNGRLRWDPA